MATETTTTTLAQLAEALGLEFRGQGYLPVTGVGDINQIEETGSAGTEKPNIFFIESEKIIRKGGFSLEQLKSLTVLVPASLSESFDNALICDEASAPRVCFIRLLELFEPRFAIPFDAPIDSSAEIGEGTVVMPGASVMQSVKIGKNCILYPGVVIEPFSVIGDNTVIYSNTVISRLCKIGSNCIIHANAVIGADGFGFYDAPDGVRYKVPQIGNVEIDDHVELGAGCTIDRATIGSTRIGEYTKLDNQVHIAHNCNLGRRIYISAATGIAGSTVVEDNCTIGGMVAIADHVHIGKGTVIMSTSGVPQSVSGGIHYGFPARPVREQHRVNASVSKLPKLIQQVRELENRID